MNQLKAIANKATEQEMNALCNWFSAEKLASLPVTLEQGVYTDPLQQIHALQLGAINFLKEQFRLLRVQTPVEKRVSDVNWIIDDIVVPATDLVPVKTAAKSGDVMRVYSAHAGGLNLYFGHDITHDELSKGKQYILTQTGWNNIATQDEYNFILTVRRIFGFTKVRLINDTLDFSEYGF